MNNDLSVEFSKSGQKLICVFFFQVPAIIMDRLVFGESKTERERVWKCKKKKVIGSVFIFADPVSQWKALTVRREIRKRVCWTADTHTPSICAKRRPLAYKLLKIGPLFLAVSESESTTVAQHPIHVCIYGLERCIRICRITERKYRCEVSCRYIKVQLTDRSWQTFSGARNGEQGFVLSGSQNPARDLWFCELGVLSLFLVLSPFDSRCFSPCLSFLSFTGGAMPFVCRTWSSSGFPRISIASRGKISLDNIYIYLPFFLFRFFSWTSRQQSAAFSTNDHHLPKTNFFTQRTNVQVRGEVERTNNTNIIYFKEMN